MDPKEVLTEKQIELINNQLLKLDESINVDNFKKIKTILNRTFGEENNQILKVTLQDIVDKIYDNGYHLSSTKEWDERYKTNSSSSYEANILAHLRSASNTRFDRIEVIIRFPKITITNGKQSHEILDLFVMFALTPKGTVSGTINGTRMTLTELEAQAQYLHSHLHRQTVTSSECGKFTQFCLGSGEINQVISVLNTVFTEVNFTLFCLHIQSFVAWESIEGTPYISISNLQENIHSSTRPVYSPNTAEYKKMAEKLIEVIFRKNSEAEILSWFSFSISDRGIEVVINEIGEEALSTLIGTDINISTVNRMLSSQHILAFSCFKDSVGSYHPALVTTSGSNRITRWNKDVKFKFKGEDKRLNILINEPKKEEIQKNKVYANPAITSEVCRLISRIFTKAAINDEVPVK